MAALDATGVVLSLVAALIAAISEAILGHPPGENSAPAHRLPRFGLGQKWHHVLGLACMTFVLTWIFQRLVVDDPAGCSRPASPFRRGHGFDLQAPRIESLPNAGIDIPPTQEVEWFRVQSAVLSTRPNHRDAQRLISLIPHVRGCTQR